DEAIKTRLLREPAEVLEEYDIPLPEGVQVRLVENTDKVIHLVLPSEPPGKELTDAQLSQISAGVYLCRCIAAGPSHAAFSIGTVTPALRRAPAERAMERRFLVPL